MAEVGGAWSWNRCYSLMVMTVAYIVGEVAHFLINTTGRAVAREIHFGESACFPANESKVATNCTAVEEQEECESEGCSWDYSGLGLEYQVRLPKYTWYTSNAPPPQIFTLQVLAGPAFVAVFSVSAVILATTSDRMAGRLPRTLVSWTNIKSDQREANRCSASAPWSFQQPSLVWVSPQPIGTSSSAEC